MRATAVGSFGNKIFTACELRRYDTKASMYNRTVSQNSAFPCLKLDLRGFLVCDAPEAFGIRGGEVAKSGMPVPIAPSNQRRQRFVTTYVQYCFILLTNFTIFESRKFGAEKIVFNLIVDICK